MREIKLRAKENIHNEFIYSNGYYFDGINYWFIMSSENKALAFAKHVTIDASTLSQFIGLYDRNGVEIYEGDIIDDGFGVGIVEFMRGAFRVNYKNGSAKWLIDYLESEKKFVEVIGDIYEKPLLILK